MLIFTANILSMALSVWAYCNWKQIEAVNLLAPIVIGINLQYFFQKYLDNQDYIYKSFKIIYIWFLRQDLRISFASLVRIKVDDNKYVLLESRRFKNVWQPVGGVYKYFDTDIRRKFGLQDDNGEFKRVEPTELRLSFPHSKIFNIFSFMKWFDSRLGREISPNREFREELLDTNILDKNIFNDVNFEFINRFFEIRFSDKFKKWELMAFEIFELKCSNEQKNQIKASLAGDKFKALTKKQIDQDGFIDESTNIHIGSHTKHIL